jgi:hypothetical protein
LKVSQGAAERLTWESNREGARMELVAPSSKTTQRRLPDLGEAFPEHQATSQGRPKGGLRIRGNESSQRFVDATKFQEIRKQPPKTGLVGEEMA